MENEVGRERLHFTLQPGGVAHVGQHRFAERVATNEVVEVLRGFGRQGVAFHLGAQQVQPLQQPGPLEAGVAGEKHPLAGVGGA